MEGGSNLQSDIVECVKKINEAFEYVINAEASEAKKVLEEITKIKSREERCVDGAGWRTHGMRECDRVCWYDVCIGPEGLYVLHNCSWSGQRAMKLDFASLVARLLGNKDTINMCERGRTWHDVAISLIRSAQQLIATSTPP